MPADKLVYVRGGTPRELSSNELISYRVTGLAKELPLNWIELYPAREHRSVVNVEGERTAVEDLQLSDPLYFVARAEGTVRPGA